jgi:hypothetical protein
MGNAKIEFFIIRTFEDLVFTRKDFTGSPQHIAELLDKVNPFRSRIKFEKEFGGDGTEASVVYGDSTYSSQWAGGISKLTRFEVMYSDEDEPRGYQTMEEINEEFLKRSLNKNSI